MPENREEILEQEILQGEKFTDGFFTNVKFPQSNKAYFFHTYDETINVDDKVVVETVRGIELGTVISPLQETQKLGTDIALKSIIRKANELDVRNYENNVIAAKRAIESINQSIALFQLEMHVIDVTYTLDSTKLIISYVSESRVDFRELLKDLASKFRCRIELRQIGTRDRSKLVSGIAICGLPLCCATFLNEFDGISINMAKNQCLALNIQKLSGHCGKLICCLKFEDDNYTEARKNFPKIGQRLHYDNQEYRITGFNVIAETARLENHDNIINVAIKDIIPLIKDGKN